MPLGDSLPFDGFVQGNMAFQSDAQYSLNQDPRTIIDGYARVNLAAGIRSKDDKYSLQVFVNNAFNDHAPATLTFLNIYGGRTVSQPTRDQYRYWGIRGSYSF